MAQEVIRVFVEKADDGTYWGSTQNLPGGVTAYGNSLEELKESFTSAFNDYLEIAEDLDEDWIDEVKSIERVEYVMNIPSLFKLLPELKISSIAKKAGINESLMRQYASGKANASEERAKIIENAIHELGQELISVSL
ncbi:MAG: hypothetical protein CMP12_01915 [Zunongwangia sp.]|uniref:Type II toxin-antitoxin system HicB family antitoxin n=2 Tax=Zunongwangia profunda TaxID=398743 RepID=D5BES0_ZUNPS|nr:hypothetical protein [Zunongwangia profunda]ADF50799.1 conserved hypothetical protein [Zunongwangia profunda SM-A87]MAO34665.1 hypothetical protein [Zunongwangia sp.]MAS69791.1 hypothetical protein [Zunongwangia sp.]HCV82332.1 hypothetical protein [Zunongwangia profunda]|tara:strand:- start:598 stop:1011 length:414 start_codon:yes stop_codon:yes gene_type:complete